MRTIARRRLLQAAAAGSAALLATSRMASGQGATVKIGAVMPRQGVFALHGEAALLGMKVAMDQFGSRVMGRPIEFISLDDPTPQDGQQNMRKLIEENHVCAVIGGTNSSTALAMAALAPQLKTPTLITQSSAEDITGKSCNRYVFRVNGPTTVYARRLVREVLPRGKKWYFVYGAYAFGQDAYAAMKAQLEAAGGTDIGMDAAPVGTTDFSSIILKIRQARPEVVALGLAGNDLTSFLKQYSEFGLRDKIPLATLVVADQELWAQTDPTGLVGKFWHYNNPANSPPERELNDAILKATGKPASHNNAMAWVAMRMLLSALDKANSTEPAAIVGALETIRPQGVPGYFREWDHQFISPLVIGQVRNVVTDKYDLLSIVEPPKSQADVEALYETRASSACHMPSL